MKVLVCLALLAATASADELSLESTVRSPTLSGSVTVDSAEARRVPGATGEALKVVESLPGVARRSSIGTNGLVVWGSGPADTRVLVDDMPLPSLYHLGGARALVAGELVSRITLTPGGYGAPYGGGLGGLLQITTKSLPSDGVHGSIAVDLLDASASLSAAITPRLRVAVAGRYGYLDRVLPAFLDAEAALRVPTPGYADYQLKAELSLRSDESLSLVYLGADDKLARSGALTTTPSAGVTETERQTRHTERLQLRYRRVTTAGTLDLSAFGGWDSDGRETTFATVVTDRSAQTWRYGLRGSYRFRPHRRVTLMLGVDVEGARGSLSRSGSFTQPPREGDPVVFGRPPGAETAFERYRAGWLRAALFVDGELRFGALTVSPGVRVEALILDGDHALPDASLGPPRGWQKLTGAVDPRLTVRLKADRQLTLFASAGLYHQLPELGDLGPVFGTPTLGPSRAAQITGGLEARLREVATAEVTAFYKELSDLVTRSPASSPSVAAALAQDGRGLVYGGQILLRLQGWRGLSGWVAYTLSHTTRQDHPGSVPRPFDWDQTHVLTVVAGWSGHGWSVGARLRVATGSPRTDVVGAYYDAHADRFEPRLGPTNGARLPDFVALDLRVEKTFVLRRARLTLSLDVQNVTNHANVEEFVYSADYSQRAGLTGLPILAIAGAGARF